MFAITADQIRSRAVGGRADAMVATIVGRWGDALTLPMERSAGDEVQALTADATAAVAIALRLTEDSDWRVGIGVGQVDELGSSVHATTGPAFVAARTAVDLARRARRPLVIGADGVTDELAARADELDAIAALIVEIRQSRTDAGREVARLVDELGTQTAAALELGITAAAASDRARRAHLRPERRAVTALVALLQRLDDDIDRVGRT